MSAAAYLQRELKDLPRSLPHVHIELQEDNILRWRVGIYIGDKDSKYYGAFLRAEMIFPTTYPFQPPVFKFVPHIYHPNVYRDGKVCISILHEAGNVTSGEHDNETWSAAQSVESILLSIISILEDPNPDSPANVDAAKLYRLDTEKYFNEVAKDVKRSKLDIPEDFVIPEQSQYLVPVEDDWYYDQEEEEDIEFDDDAEGDDYDDDDDDDDDQSFAENNDVEMSEDDEVTDVK